MTFASRIFLLVVCYYGLGSADKESACTAGDVSSIPGWGRSHGEGNGNPLRCSSWRIPGTEGSVLEAEEDFCWGKPHLPIMAMHVLHPSQFGLTEACLCLYWASFLSFIYSSCGFKINSINWSEFSASLVFKINTWWYNLKKLYNLIIVTNFVAANAFWLLLFSC